MLFFLHLDTLMTASISLTKCSAVTTASDDRHFDDYAVRCAVPPTPKCCMTHLSVSLLLHG